MRAKLHLLHQLFRQWQDFVLGAENVVNGDTAGNLLEVPKLDFRMNILGRKIGNDNADVT